MTSIKYFTRSIPNLARSISSSSAPALTSTSTATETSTSSTTTTNKDHHILTYPSSAFPLGYSVASTHSGIKKKAGALDLGILVSTSETPCAAAACLTRNVFKAAPVVVSTQLLQSGKGRVRGFIVNSGCANAVTGKKGLEDAWGMSKAVTDLLPPAKSGATSSASSTSTNDSPSGTLVMSTGVIGQHLPISKILSSIPILTQSLSSTPGAWLDLAKSFMTTDTFPKLRTKTFQLGGRTVRMAGIDKGAGMIAPNMGPPQPPQPPHATLLGIIATDAAIAPESLQSALNYAVDRSFNSITVDGDMSTNDSILCLANGAAFGAKEKVEEISEENHPEEFAVFRDELRTFAEELAQLVVRDGEGATKFVTVRVKNAPSFDVANAVARSVATSSLVKCAMYGEDANWGRILCAVGYTPLTPNPLNPSKISVSFLPSAHAADSTPLKLLTNGEPEPNIDEARASVILAEEDLEVEIDLGDGSEEARVWTCDFSHEYVTINGSYRS